MCSIDGDKARFPQDVPLLRIISRIISSLKPSRPERIFELFPYCLKEFKIEGMFQKEAVTIDSYNKVLDIVDREEPSKAHLINIHSGSIVFGWPCKHFFIKH